MAALELSRQVGEDRAVGELDFQPTGAEGLAGGGKGEHGHFHQRDATSREVASHVGRRVQHAFLGDLADQQFSVEWGVPEDLSRAYELCERYRTLALGLVDASVIAVCERLRASAIATLDLRPFGAVEILGRPRLLPRDLG